MTVFNIYRNPLRIRTGACGLTLYQTAIHFGKRNDIDKKGLLYREVAGSDRIYESKYVLQKIRPSATNAICQMLLLIIPRLPVNHKMANCKQDLDHDLR